MNDRILPHDLEAEAFLLDACLCPGGIEKVVDLVKPDDFYSEGGRLIFAKMLDLHRSGCGFTLYQIDQTFQNHSDYIGIRRILDTLRPVTAESATHYAKIIKRLSLRRQTIQAAYFAYESLHDLSTPIERFAGLFESNKSFELITNGGAND